MVEISDNRRRRYALAAVSFTAALSIQSLFTSSRQPTTYVVEEESNSLHRNLYNVNLHGATSHPNVATVTTTPGAAKDELQSEDIQPNFMDKSYANLIDNNQPIPPYDIKDAIQTSNIFIVAYALLIYDPNTDAFVVLYHKRHRWPSSKCAKLFTSIKELTYLLRKTFPERFMGPGSDELVLPVSSGDSPKVKKVCLDYYRKPSGEQLYTCEAYTAPILNFGSTFQDVLHQMIAMPMPVAQHLKCFHAWAEKQTVCPALSKNLVYGDEYGIQWEDLIPQVVWRGSDFNYLGGFRDSVGYYLGRVIPGQHKPYPNENLINWTGKLTRKFQENTILGGISAWKANVMKRKLNRIRKRAPKRAANQERKLHEFRQASALMSMRDNYDSFTPRWKGVIWTAEAELTAGLDELPWANIKFACSMNGTSTTTWKSDTFNKWENIGISAAGERMNLEELAHYKYQIDIGGGGGTTWTGTIQKMAMPGLLFHHITPTKDYIHDYMKAWVHYVPIQEDLSDLKEQFDWAESHPQEAKRIAEEGTKLMRYLTSHEGYQDMFNKDIVEPLRRVMEAYQPLSQSRGHGWTDWKDALHQLGEDGNLRKVLTVQ